MWVVDYLEDIDSDMSVFHRVDDAHTVMPAALYFERADRLAAYPGVIRARVMELQSKAGGVTSMSTPGRMQVSDDVALAQLEAEGWLDHNKGGD